MPTTRPIPIPTIRPRRRRCGRSAHATRAPAPPRLPPPAPALPEEFPPLPELVAPWHEPAAPPPAGTAVEVSNPRTGASVLAVQVLRLRPLLRAGAGGAGRPGTYTAFANTLPRLPDITRFGQNAENTRVCAPGTARRWRRWPSSAARCWPSRRCRRASAGLPRHRGPALLRTRGVDYRGALRALVANLRAGRRGAGRIDDHPAGGEGAARPPSRPSSARRARPSWRGEWRLATRRARSSTST